MSAKLIWATPDAEAHIAYLARVSNPSASMDDDSGKLIKYLIDHNHWSPLEMASICIEIETTRDIGRQLLRHRSFHFQEFSQRYSSVQQEEPILRSARVQDWKNRQNSLVTYDDQIHDAWDYWQDKTWKQAYKAYKAALDMGIAKEQARALLPEGLTKTKLHMCGTIRDWYHYLKVRTANGTQLEHTQLAYEIAHVCHKVAPSIFLEIVVDDG